MEAHIFPDTVAAYDIADCLVDVVLKDDRGNTVTIRFMKEIALDLRDQLTAKLKNEPFCEGKKKVEVHGRCPKCDEPVPPGFYECSGNGSHPAVSNLPR